MRYKQLSGYFQTDHHPDKFNKIQILSVEDLLDGKGINFAYSLFAPDTFKKATKKNTESVDQIGMEI